MPWTSCCPREKKWKMKTRSWSKACFDKDDIDINLKNGIDPNFKSIFCCLFGLTCFLSYADERLKMIKMMEYAMSSWARQQQIYISISAMIMLSTLWATMAIREVHIDCSLMTKKKWSMYGAWQRIDEKLDELLALLIPESMSSWMFGSPFSPTQIGFDDPLNQTYMGNSPPWFLCLHRRRRLYEQKSLRILRLIPVFSSGDSLPSPLGSRDVVHGKCGNQCHWRMYGMTMTMTQKEARGIIPGMNWNRSR